MNKKTLKQNRAASPRKTPQSNQTQDAVPREQFERKHAPFPPTLELAPTELFLSRKALARRWGTCAHTIARRKDLKPLYLNSRLIRYKLADVQAIEAAGVA
ncbi:MAG: hypothetical protein ABSH34_32050 [Verrucomicrobiota bacterium]|jgi:hypothetical protein